MIGGEVLTLIFSGQSYRRASWEKGSGIFYDLDDKELYYYTSDMSGANWTFGLEDIEATDWEIVEEESI